MNSESSSNGCFDEIVKRLNLTVLSPDEAPDTPGFYLLFSADGSFIYVGKASSLKSQIAYHFSGREENKLIKDNLDKVIWRQTNTIEQAELSEGQVYDKWVELTGRAPYANRIRPPKSKLTIAESLAKKLENLLRGLQ